MRCIECEEIELARVSDERPGADAADPVRGARRVPGRAHPARPDPPPAAAVGRGRLRLGLRRQGARLGAGLGVGRRGRRRAAGPLPRAALPRGWQRRAQRRSSRTTPPTTRPTSRARPKIHRGKGPRKDVDGNRRPDRLACRCPVPGGAALAFSNPTVSERRRRQLGQALQFTGDAALVRLRHALRQRHGRRRLGPRDHARGRRQAVQPEPLRQLGHLVPGHQRPQHQDGLARAAGSTATARDTNPLQAISIDTALSKAIRTSAKPVCAIPSLPMAGFTMNSSNVGGVNGYNVNPQVRNLLAGRRAAPTTRTCGARARPTISRSRPTCARPGARRRVPASPLYPNTSTLVRTACGPPRTCCRRTSARGSSRSTGAGSTPTPASSPARTASSPSSRARSARSRPT